MNSFGRIFRIQIQGESHGPEIGVTVDGCPSGLPLQAEEFAADIDRRRSGAAGTTARREEDLPEITAGLFRGKTTGAPLAIRFANHDTRSGDYDRFRDHPRPGQADFTARFKYGGYADHRGGGHFSGRLTLGLVAAGVVAKKLIAPTRISARAVEAGGTSTIEAAVQAAIADHDSIGGLIEGRAETVPAGLGEPFFDSLESLLAHLLFAIPGITGVEFGDGFAAAGMRGSEYNDPIIDASGSTPTNHAGGVNGGISNGNPLRFRVAARPTASIGREQDTFHMGSGRVEPLIIGGRHDACFALRLPVIVEAAAAIVLADLMLLEQRIPRIWEKP